MPKRKTCLNCRRRKIRCDAQTPSCRQCLNSKGFGDCEYPGAGQTPTQVLRERIAHLQNRIQALEDPGESVIALRHPYNPGDVSSSNSPAYSNSSGSENFSPVERSSVSRSPVPIGQSDASQVDVPEPAAHTMQLMLNDFLAECQRFGFFLNVDRFHKLFMLPLPIGHYSRPSSALISAIYLWSSHLSPSLCAPLQESDFLNSTLHHLSKDLSGSHPHRVIHGIQTEVLLSYYYLKNGKVLQGNYHANAALSLSLSAGLHRNRFPGILSDDDSFGQLDFTILPPADAVEEVQRVDAFWAVLILNNYWVTIQESRYMFYDLTDGDIDVNTPWPMDVGDYEMPFLPQESNGTLKHFLDNTSIEGFSEMAIYAKATILLEQATSLHTEDKDLVLQSGAFASLDELIEGFKVILLLYDQADTSLSTKETYFMTQIMTNVATIKLHQPFSSERTESRDKLISAAQSISSVTEDMISLSSSRVHVNPILGVLWTSACEALLHAMNISRPETLRRSLETIMSQMTRFSEHSILMKILVMRLQRNYGTRLKSDTH